MYSRNRVSVQQELNYCTTGIELVYNRNRVSVQQELSWCVSEIESAKAFA